MGWPGLSRRSFLALIFVSTITRSHGAECTFDPSRVETAQAVWRRISRQAEAVTPPARRRAVQPLAPRNFVDREIFENMQRDGIRWTTMSSDEEFLRRVFLDLTGQIPPSETVKAFLADRSTGKRDRVIEELLASEEFDERWTLWFGDLVQMAAWTPDVGHGLATHCFASFVRTSFRERKPYDALVRELITAVGHSYVSGPPNYWARQVLGYGPPQDTFDNLSAATAEQFLALPLNCLSCHDGKGHMEQTNAYLAGRTRLDFWKNSAFFARDSTYFDGPQTVDDFAKFPCQTDEYGWGVARDPNGEYRLNTTYGARSPRQPPADGASRIDPAFFLSGELPAAGEQRRDAYARMLTGHPQFARATVNYIWKEIFGIGLVEPANSHDLLRQDLATLRPGQTLQPTHPDLLTKLAGIFVQSGYDVRELLRTIVTSNAYQLSSAYTPGPWNEAWTPYYARHYPRRLLAESIVDAIVRATGVPMSDAILRRYARAMQFPSPDQPSPIGPQIPGPETELSEFMRPFTRGDRISTPRSSEGSVLQAMQMLNNSFVTTRVKAEHDSTIQRLLSTTNDPGAIADELYIATLSRRPTAQERKQAVEFLRNGDLTRNAEDLQFALLNRIEFLYK